MRKSLDYDVIVVGAGPAGSAAAKKCAERGFKTLVLEKRKLPRDKVIIFNCSGRGDKDLFIVTEKLNVKI